MSHFPGDLANPKLEVSGVFSDGWLAEKASLNLAKPAGDRTVTVRGTVPKVSDANFHTEIGVFLDNQEIGWRSVGIGDFEISGLASGPAGQHRVTVTFTTSQQLPGGDGRSVGALLKFVGFETPKSPGASVDIVRTAGVQLGSNWGALEKFRNENFRWVDNDAQILLAPGTEGERISMIVEPGPGLDGPLLLKILDAAGRQVDAVRVDRRASVDLFLPIEANKVNEFRLHAEGGGKHISNDPRILNFRVFQISRGSWRSTT